MIKLQIEIIARGVILRQGNILLCKAQGSDYFFFPGGHVEIGETSVEALRRELKEEIGVDAFVGDFTGVVENIFEVSGEKRQEINLVFAVEIPAGDISSREAHLEFFWKTPEEIQTEKVLPVVMKEAVLQWLRDEKNFYRVQK